MAVLNKIYCDRCDTDITNRDDCFKLTEKYIKINKEGTKVYPTIKTLDICPQCWEEFKKFLER